jgi:hypothetical protein
MPVDPEYLRQHYASLSDEGLLAINRSDLVSTAQKCYDDELARRDLAAPKSPRRADGRQVASPAPSPDQEDGDAEPDWLDDAAEVFSRVDTAGSTPGPDMVNARDALEAAGIPCYLDLHELTEEKSVSAKPTHQWRLMVPGDLNLHATSILERDIFNPDFEAEWKTHLETFSDDELRAMDPEAVFCGLFDRIERVTRAYDEELARRRL